MKLGSPSDLYTFNVKRRLPESLKALLITGGIALYTASDITNLLKILPAGLEVLVLPKHPIYWDKTVSLPNDLVQLEMATDNLERNGHLFYALPPNLTSLIINFCSSLGRLKTNENSDTPWKLLPRSLTRLDVFFEGPFPEASELPVGLEYLRLISSQQREVATESIIRSYMSTLRCLKDISVSPGLPIPLSLETIISLPLPPSLSSITVFYSDSTDWSVFKNMPTSVKSISFEGLGFSHAVDIELPPQLTSVSKYPFYQLDHLPEQLLDLSLRSLPSPSRHANLKLPPKLTSLECSPQDFDAIQAFSILPHTLTTLRLIEYHNVKLDIVKDMPDSSKTLPPSINTLVYQPNTFFRVPVDTTVFILNLSTTLPLRHLELIKTNTDWKRVRERNPNFSFWPDLDSLHMSFSNWQKELFASLPRRLSSLNLFFPFDSSYAQCQEYLKLLPISIPQNNLIIADQEEEDDGDLF